MSTFSTYRKSGATATYPLPVDRYSIHLAGSSSQTGNATFDPDLFDIGTNDVSVSFWVKSPAVSAYNVIIDAIQYWYSNRFRIAIQNTGKVSAGFSQVGAYDGDCLSASTIDDDSWHHIVYTWDRSTESKIYIDGALDSTESDVNTGTSFDTNGIGVVGNVGLAVVNFTCIDVNLHDFAMWDNIILSADDVTSLYNSGTPNDLTNAASYDTDRTSALEVYWRMEENTGTTIVDSSGNDWTMTFDGSNPAVWSNDTP